MATNTKNPTDDDDPTKQPAKEGELVPAGEGPSNLAYREEHESGIAALWKKANQVRHNFEGDERQKFRMQMLCQSDAEKGGNHLNETIAVKFWMVHVVQLEKTLEDGEVVKFEAFRSVLVDANGKAFAFVSDGVAKGIVGLSEMFGTGAIDPPFEVQIKQKNGKGANRYFVMVPVSPEIEGPKKK